MGGLRITSLSLGTQGVVGTQGCGSISPGFYVQTHEIRPSLLCDPGCQTGEVVLSVGIRSEDL